MRQPGCNPRHLHHVFDALRAQRIGMHDLVGQRQLFIEAIQMPDRGVDVDGFHRIAARDMDAVEVLRQLDEFPECLEITRPFSPLHVISVQLLLPITIIGMYTSFFFIVKVLYIFYILFHIPYLNLLFF